MLSAEKEGSHTDTHRHVLCMLSCVLIPCCLPPLLPLLHLQDTDADSGDEGYGPESESASPTIPALRSSPFQQSSGPVPPLMLGLPRFKSQLSSSTAQQAQQQQQAQQGGGATTMGGGGMAVPRLNLTHSMHSTLEARNASAEIQVQCGACLAGWAGLGFAEHICECSVLAACLPACLG